VINYRAFGTTGTAEAPFDKGRTATHEIGHYFNLRHIWGDTGGLHRQRHGRRYTKLRWAKLRHTCLAARDLQQRAKR
jgi:hypothetical protein